MLFRCNTVLQQLMKMCEDLQYASQELLERLERDLGFGILVAGAMTVVWNVASIRASMPSRRRIDDRFRNPDHPNSGA